MAKYNPVQESTALHMKDLDDNVAILPQSLQPSDTSDIADNFQDATFVDVAEINSSDAKITDFTEYVSTGKGLTSRARVSADGRLLLSLDFKRKLPDLPKDYAREVNEFAVDKTEWNEYPSMNIVIMIVGSRGDVQPFVALGKGLLKDGHRVRIATHETFRAFVTGAGLEFFNIGGDPQDLMSYMVKNPGLMPGIESLTNGDINRKRKMLAEMINGCWMACHAPCSATGQTFAADAIISNPPAFAHVHCAEALGIPLLLSFTMPWSPTTAFPHPLVNISQSNAENRLTNYLSYAVTDIFTWQGIGDLINTFRTRTLGLEPLTLRSGPGLLDRVKVPWTYCMSPGLVPKPDDWKSHIDVVGFYFLDLASSYEPPDDLAAFLAAGEPPVYIGFGSVVVDDPASMTRTIFEATEQAGIRALVSAGWGGLGGTTIPPHIFILGNIPHDWLFDKNRVAAVVHHGGAGTTAIGLAHGRPTVVVPFFGDQGFWGSMIHKAGAGPEPIPAKKLSVGRLKDAILFSISPPAKQAAAELARQIQAENGVRKGVDSFYRHLPLLNMRCDIDPSKLAVWWSTEYCLKLSAFAAQTLIDAGIITMDSLDAHRPKEYDTRKQVSDPATGGANAIFWTITHYYAGIAEIFYSPVKGIINTTTAIPFGVVKIVTSVQEGFQNAPALYGSDVRKPGKVTGFKSGLKEAGKGLFYGYYDGITGLVREPIQGAKKEGFIGAIKGSARSFVNVTVRPAAGILGVVALPFQGVWKSVQSTTGRRQEEQQRETRIADGVHAFDIASRSQRENVLKNFDKAKHGTEGRLKAYKEAAQKAMFEDSSPQPGPSPSASSLSPVKSRTSSSNSRQDRDTPQTLVATFTDEDDEAAFERDLALATQLSLAEHERYEEWK